MNFQILISRARASPKEIPSQEDISQIVGYCDMRAHQAFGPRATSLTPQLALREDPPYPETLVDGTSVIVVLQTNRSWIGYFYEAAHEVVHALDATEATSGKETWLEEGIATAFSLSIVEEVFDRKSAGDALGDPTYRRAYRMVSRVDRDTTRLGQQLRAQAGTIPTVSRDDVLALYPNVSQSLLSHLFKRFEHPDR